MPLLLFSIAGLGLAVVVYLQRQVTAQPYTPGAAPDGPPAEGTSQETTPMEDVQVTLDPTSYTPAAVSLDTATQNEKSFLDMLAFSEGVAAGDDGYRTLFGGQFFDSFADHPRQVFPFTNKRGETLRTSAAGRYQFLARTWDDIARRLNLPDFSPENQDRAALELVRQRGALADVQAGRIQMAIAKCAPIWASLPGAGYAQHENKLTSLVAQYQASGGNLEA